MGKRRRNISHVLNIWRINDGGDYRTTEYTRFYPTCFVIFERDDPGVRGFWVVENFEKVLEIVMGCGMLLVLDEGRVKPRKGEKSSW